MVNFISEAQKDIVENVDEFIAPSENPLATMMRGSMLFAAKNSAFLRRYEVNLIVDHSSNHGAPVIHEDNPTYQNLIGRVEYIAHLGALTTDFNLIRAGFCFPLVIRER